MRKYWKKAASLGLALALATGLSMPALADSDYVVGTENPDLFAFDEDLADGWHWVNDGTDSGGSVCVYIQNDKRLRNTTTPDGSKVNTFGEWYTWNKLMPITKVMSYSFNGHKFPFSYDGKVLKNDYLGIQLTFDETDLQNGYDGSIANWAGAPYFRFFNLSFGKPIGMGRESFCLFISPTDYGNAEAAKQLNEFPHQYYLDGYSMFDSITYECEIAGKKFYGTKAFAPDRDTSTQQYELFCSLPTGGSLRIYMVVLSDEAFKEAVDYLGTHLTLSW